jgi:hypothetical protein
MHTHSCSSLTLALAEISQLDALGPPDDPTKLSKSEKRVTQRTVQLVNRVDIRIFEQAGIIVGLRR